MPKQTINNIPGALPPLPVYSQVVISKGTVYVSGSIGFDHEFNIVGGVQAQTKAALDNMKTLLERAGSGFNHILKVTVYLTNLERDFNVFNEIYMTYFDGAHKLPARTCIGVTALALGGSVEVDCIAELANED